MRHLLLLGKFDSGFELAVRFVVRLAFRQRGRAQRVHGLQDQRHVNALDAASSEGPALSKVRGGRASEAEEEAILASALRREHDRRHGQDTDREW